MDVSTQINSIIDKLAEKLGMAVDQIVPYFQQLFSLYIKQAYIEGIKSSIWAVIGLIMIVASIVFIYIFAKKTFRDPSDRPAIIFVFTLPLAVGLIMLCTNIGCIFNAFGNPEKWALDHIIQEFIR